MPKQTPSIQLALAAVLLMPAASAQICYQISSTNPAAVLTIKVPTLPTPVPYLAGLIYDVQPTGGASYELTAGGKVYTATSRFTLTTYPSTFLSSISTIATLADGTNFGVTLTGPGSAVPASGVLPVSIPPLSGWYSDASALFLGKSTYPISSISNCSLSGPGGGTSGLNITLDTRPSGLQLIVDQALVDTPKVVSWTPGSKHTLTAFTKISKDNNAYTFASWSSATNFPVFSPADLIVTASTSITSYTATFTLVPGPIIFNVDNAAGAGQSLAPGTWMAATGYNLASTTRVWGAADFSGDNLPTSLDGVRVLVNNKPAFVYYVSPRQVNFLAPDGLPAGQAVPIQIVNSLGTSAPEPVVNFAVSPAFFTYSQQGGRYAIALDASTYAYLGPVGLFGGAAASQPAVPGQIITLYATGLGLTSPATDTSKIVATANSLAIVPQVSIGGAAATVLYSGLTGSGLYQINVAVPAGVQAGDAEVRIMAGGRTSPARIYLAVGK